MQKQQKSKNWWCLLIEEFAKSSFKCRQISAFVSNILTKKVNVPQKMKHRLLAF